ncbi:Fe(3+) ions import ATP-binding protein FbpC [Candidatus Phycosocius bacilliformis]|uniref:Fe(3+) ions import ATP-binding protein FbpC n=1 Tax=Candidatus Phycosocius bacilliformis TaxID=1445552 RepID=A0A2P2EB95_9PROT|nr:ABC transporter ATP-binding protein [Candidatus Phycosocius bacilliformis]GBF58324.1 Fe(3+) ions import ATP-binding protein FbpC [Candidatus Phycosocius bacilliformis]
MTQFALEARAISRAFGAVKALDGVSLSVPAGKVVALLGQSGSGKSTLLRVLAGLEGIDAGQVLADGHVVSDAQLIVPPEQRPLGMVFQDYALFPHLTALGNVAFGLGKQPKAARLALAENWLDRVGLSHRANAYPHQLSGGEQQRVALARALAPSPRAVLMDEPFSGLDPHLRAELQARTLATLADAGVAALIVSHDTEEALAVADEVAIIEAGRILQSGLPHEVYNQPASLAAARALGAVWALEATSQHGRVETPFGTFPCPHVGQVLLCARPEATQVTLAPDGMFGVTDRRGVGRFRMLRLKTHASPIGTVMAQVEANKAPEIGSAVHIEISPEDVFIFPHQPTPAT